MLHSYKFLNFVFVNNNNKRHYRQCCFLLHACLDCLTTTGVVSLCFYATLCLSATTTLWSAHVRASGHRRKQTLNYCVLCLFCKVIPALHHSLSQPIGMNILLELPIYISFSVQMCRLHKKVHSSNMYW